MVLGSNMFPATWKNFETNISMPELLQVLGCVPALLYHFLGFLAMVGVSRTVELCLYIVILPHLLLSRGRMLFTDCYVCLVTSYESFVALLLFLS